ncbi:MAG: EamA family transporter [Burkholderiales bacterium]|nr:EamA family transporter [Burkholderiales bacterium]MDE1929479.1 EamA family transporter [Burkholderiales bacterium]
MTSGAPPSSDPVAPGRAIVAACLGATWFLWGSTYLAIKWALTSLPPLFQMGSRFIAAGLIVGAWAHWRGARWPSRREWVSAAWLGALMLAGGYGGTAWAEVTVGSGLVVAFIAVTPALVAVAQWPYGVRPTALEAAGIVLGLAGVLLLVRGQGFAASPVGLGAMVLACTTWALGSVWSLRGLPGGRDLALAPGAAGYASQMLVGGAMLLLGSLVAGEHPRWPPDARALACWAYLVVAGSLLGFLAYMELLRRTSMTLASSYTFVNPVIALLLGVGLGGEQVSRLEWSAAGVVLLGVVLLLGRRR